MAVSFIKKQSSTYGKSGTLGRVFSNLWTTLGNKLQQIHQTRKNNKTYYILLDNDDYLLRDIGVSRDDIHQMRSRTDRHDAGRELEKIRTTSGRFISH